jgi:hydroxymethylpyrimidine kinase/phosphomethylpyrimidine kinase/thiamine-phosphate diphosphorylase
MSARPVVWTIAGSDSGGGAGVQADLRALDAFGVHGCSAISAITAQNSVAVSAIDVVSPRMLDAQLAALAADMPPTAIKTGMLGSRENLEMVARWVDRLREANPALALVVDPVLRATTGAQFADEELRRAYLEQLAPRATLVTPNRAEAATLLGVPPLAGGKQVEHAARMLREAGAKAVVITGGDVRGDFANDYVSAPWASGWLRLPRVGTPHHHGTGCVFASSAAAALALGFVEVEAVVLAKMATTQALRDAYPAGSGAGPVHPSAAFSSRIDNLPEFVAQPGATNVPFAPLRDADLGLYAIVDSADWVERVLAAGVKTVQLRIKDPTHPRLREEIRRSVAAGERARAQLFVNDHWRMAIEERAYGVHLGQEDIADADTAAIARAGLRLGLSTHSYWEVCRARALRPSYIACGPIHSTAAKAMPWIPQGNANLAYWCSLLPEPVVAIAGMDPARAGEAVRCGAAGVAVISGITAAPDPEQAVRDYRDAMRSASALDRTGAPALARPTLARFKPPAASAPLGSPASTARNPPRSGPRRSPACCAPGSSRN